MLAHMIRIHHPKEMPSKSTGIHAKILAPDFVQIYEFPDFPDYRTLKDEMVLLFPSEVTKSHLILHFQGCKIC